MSRYLSGNGQIQGAGLRSRCRRIAPFPSSHALKLASETSVTGVEDFFVGGLMAAKSALSESSCSRSTCCRAASAS